MFKQFVLKVQTTRKIGVQNDSNCMFRNEEFKLYKLKIYRKKEIQNA